MTITVAGWPGAGATTLALLLAKTLEFKYFSTGQVFRYISEKLAYENTGIERIKADEYLEKSFGVILDKYTDTLILTKTSRVVIDSDIAALRNGLQKKLISVFLIASHDARSKRLQVDNRKEDVAELENREKANQDFYKKLYDIDWLDLALIKKTHSKVIDNTSISIATELKHIYQVCFQKGWITDVKLNSLSNNADYFEQEFWDKGKTKYIADLTNAELLITPEFCIKEIIKLYPDKVDQLPRQVKDILINS